MKVSTVIPILNGDAFLSDAINSILRQSYECLEVLVVDGGSIDKSIDIVESIAAVDSRVKLIHSPNSTIYEAIFEGFNHAKGDVLSWLNADDIYPPWAFNAVIMWLSNPNIHWITGLPSIWDNEGRLRCVYPHSCRPRFLIRKGCFNPGFLGAIQAESTFFSRGLFEKLSTEQMDTILATRYAGDFCLWKSLAAYSNLHSVPTVLGGFRIHGDNTSILKFDDYMAEVKSSGAICPPKKIAWLIQKVYGSFFNPVGYKQASLENKNLNISLGL